MSNKLADLNATVCIETKVLLDETSEKTGLSVGEIIDRLVLNCCPEDPEIAAAIMLDHILLAGAKLNQEAFNDAVRSLLQVIAESFSENEPEDIKDTMNSILDQFA